MKRSNLYKPVESPLVSVIVITYNSSGYVVELLESVKSQTYDKIELIISDDCSTDDTTQICNRWLDENKDRFKRIEIITSSINTGISANCNRGIKLSRGTWIKLIAGDDILLPNCISDNIHYVGENINAKIILSSMLYLQNGILSKNETPVGIRLLKKTKNAKEQYKALLVMYFGNTASLFISKDVFNIILYDEKFKNIEDYPFALNVTKQGYTFSYLDKVTVIYRIRDNSVCTGIKEGKIFNGFYKNHHEFDIAYRYPYLPGFARKYEEFEYNRKLIIDYLNLNDNRLLYRIINKMSRIINPYSFLYSKWKNRYVESE